MGSTAEENSMIAAIIQWINDQISLALLWLLEQDNDDTD